MNKSKLGLHAWGNVVPCCQACNNEKQQKDWREFLLGKANATDLASRTTRIEHFIQDKQYDPNLNLHEFAGNLYEDVGEVAMTLIRLRYKQAEAGIQQLLRPTQSSNPGVPSVHHDSQALPGIPSFLATPR